MRVLCVWLAVMVATAPSWFDRCLVRCHEVSTAAAAPRCHEEAESAPGGPAWQSTDACRHDHDASWVPPADPRQTSGLCLAIGASAVSLGLPAAFSLSSLRVVLVASPPSTHSASIPLPLRL